MDKPKKTKKTKDIDYDLPVSFDQMKEMIKLVGESLKNPKLDKENDERREIIIPLFIPQDVANTIEQSFLGNCEYQLDRNYEQGFSKLWGQFSDISFKFVTIKKEE